MRYSCGEWSLDLPEGWHAEVDDSCVTFCHTEDVGAFQVSSYRKDDVVTDADLKEFAGDIPLAAVSLAGFTGFRTRFSEGDTFWTRWWLRSGCQMIFATYNCDLADRGREDEAVAMMLDSLRPVTV